MGMLYRCDRPGCGREKTTKMNYETITLFNGVSFYSYEVYLCDECWKELRSRYVDLETKFYHELEGVHGEQAKG